MLPSLRKSTLSRMPTTDMARTLIPAQFTNGNDWKPTTDACLDVLDSAESALGATRYQMGKLLGISAPDYCRWRRGARKISSKYMAKITKILCLQLAGIPLNEASFINWKAGTIHWRNGKVSTGLNLLQPVWNEPGKAKLASHSSDQLPPSYGGPKTKQNYVRTPRG